MASPSDFTQLLEASRNGDPEAWSTLVRMVYADMRRLARIHRRANAETNSLGTTGLVHECYLRLSGSGRDRIENRKHFLNLASRIMRQALCDYARQRLASKRSGWGKREDLDALETEELAEARDLVELDQVLGQLETENPRWAQVVECRYFGGLTEDETAEALVVNVRTVQRDWHLARAWLAGRLK